MTLVRLVQHSNAIPEVGDAAAYRDAAQAGAVRERLVPDAGDAVGNRDAGEAAAIERIVPDIGDAVAYRDAGQAGAVMNAPSPMLVTLLGIVTLVRLVQAENASSPMLMTPLEIVTLVRLVQSSNAQSPILVTPSGIVMLASPAQKSNAWIPMFVTLSGIVMLVQAIAVRERPITDTGDAVGNRDADQAALAAERTAPDADDRQAVIVSGMTTAAPRPVYPVIVIAPLFVT